MKKGQAGPASESGAWAAGDWGWGPERCARGRGALGPKRPTLPQTEGPTRCQTPAHRSISLSLSFLVCMKSMC